MHFIGQAQKKGTNFGKKYQENGHMSKYFDAPAVNT
jgi:hypothetical protein